jgi:hypothetical protein
MVTTGTVTAIAADGTSFILQPVSGQPLTLAVTDPQLLQNLATGDTVQVTYTTSGSTALARVVTVTATAPAPTPAPPNPSVGGAPAN